MFTRAKTWAKCSDPPQPPTDWSKDTKRCSLSLLPTWDRLRSPWQPAILAWPELLFHRLSRAREGACVWHTNVISDQFSFKSIYCHNMTLVAFKEGQMHWARDRQRQTDTHTHTFSLISPKALPQITAHYRQKYISHWQGRKQNFNANGNTIWPNEDSSPDSTLKMYRLSGGGLAIERGRCRQTWLPSGDRLWEQCQDGKETQSIQH